MMLRVEVMRGAAPRPAQCLALLLAACCVLPARAQLPVFERVVDPLPVHDAAGTPYTFPFLGGLNTPRPHLADIDADGDADLFVQEVSGQIIFFENTGTPHAPRFTWRTDHFHGLDVGEWVRLVDLDADGDLDLLAEERFSLIRVYRNTGTPAAAAFTLAEDTLKGTYVDVHGVVRDTVLFSDRQNLPSVLDVDCNGRLDLLLGRAEGTITRFEDAGPGPDGLPRFAFVEDHYQDVLVAGEAGKTGPPLVQHGANAMAFLDVDGDGDPDLLWGDFFEPSLILFENTGSCAETNLVRTLDHFPADDPLLTGGYNVPAQADLDGDGDPELVVGVLGGAFSSTQNLADNLFYYTNEGAGAYVLQTRRLVDGLDVGRESVPAPVDLDADGDLDLVVANSIDLAGGDASSLSFFENRGTPAAPSFHAAEGALPVLDDTFNAAPAFGDLDADGDPDLLLGGFDGRLAFYRNHAAGGPPDFRLEAEALVVLDAAGQEVVLDVRQNGVPALADLDADGDLDLVVGGSSGTLHYYRNDGTPGAFAFVLVTEQFADVEVARRSAPALHDVDHDGDQDLFVGSEAEGVFFFRNTGTAAAATFSPEGVVAPALPRYATPALADVDGDGDADLFAGGEGGGVVYYENTERSAGRELTPAAPAAGMAAAVYPNPVRSTATLVVRLDAPAAVAVRLYDLLGRVVEGVLEASLPAGEHRLPLDAARLPAGVYLCRVEAAGVPAVTARLVVVR